MLLTELVQDPYDELDDDDEGEAQPESHVEAEARQAVIEVVSELQGPQEDDAGSGPTQTDDD
jgi:hypothetical protein